MSGIFDNGGFIGRTNTPTLSSAKGVWSLRKQSLALRDGIWPESPIVKDGLVLYLDAGLTSSYPGTGTTWTDLSGNGNNGTLVNGVGYSSSDGGSLIFDGVNDYSGHGDVLDMSTNSITIVSWVRPLSIRTFSTWIVSKSIAAGEAFRYACGVDANTNKPVMLFSPISTGIIAVGSTSLLTNTWYMLTCVFNRASSMQIYVNGQAETMSGTTDISAYSSTNFQSNYPYRIGSYTNFDNVGVYNPFNGNISQMLHYTRSLSQSEIQQNFDALRGRYGI